LDSRLDSGPPVVAGSTSDVVIGAYENKLRTEAKLSNFFSGVIQQAEVYKYGFVDLDILDSFQYYLEEYQPENDLPVGKDLAIALNETLRVFDSKGIPGDDGLLVEISNATNIDDFINDLPVDSEIHKLFEIVKEKEFVRAIVELNTEFQLEATLPSKDAIKKQLDDIDRNQNTLLQFLASYNISLHHKFKNVPHIAMTVDKNSLIQLLNSPLVKSIQEDRVVSPSLYYSVPLIGGDNVHSLGFTVAGKVVSEACYSHDIPASSQFTVCPNGLTVDTSVGSGEPCDSSINGCDHGTHVAGIATVKPKL